MKVIVVVFLVCVLSVELFFLLQTPKVTMQPINISWTGDTAGVHIGLIDTTFESTGRVLDWMTEQSGATGTYTWNGLVHTYFGLIKRPFPILSKGPFRIVVTSAGITGDYCARKNDERCNYALSTVFNYVDDASQISIQPISIMRPHKSTISLVSPHGGENWKVGQSYNVTWNPTPIGDVSIYLKKSGEEGCFLSSSPANSGSTTVYVSVNYCQNVNNSRVITSGTYRLEIMYNVDGVGRDTTYSNEINVKN